MNKKLIAAATLGIAAFLLQGCSSAPRVTPEQRAEQAKATLNVYEDNRVWFKDTYYTGQTHYGWTNDGKDVLVLLVDGHAYNAKDISTITSSEVNHGYKIAVVLRSGEKISSLVPYAGDNVVWLGCDTQKVCSRRTRFSMRDYSLARNPFDRMLTGIYEMDLNRSPEKNPKEYLVTDDRNAPRTGFKEVRFLTGPEISELQNKLASQEKRWAQIQDQRAKQREADLAAQQARERAIEREGAEMRKHIRVGTQTNCGQVFEVRPPMIGVQTTAGMQFIDISRLYGPSAGCRLFNGQYVGR